MRSRSDFTTRNRTIAEPDYQRLAQVIGMIGSEHRGERLNAAAAADLILKRLGLSWLDIGTAFTQCVKLLDAAQKLKAERDALLGEVERLNKTANGHGGSLAQALWQDAGTPQTVSSRSAQWVLDLAGQGFVYLAEKEADFLTSCARWRVLTPRQKDWLRDIVAMVTRRTGR